MHCKCIDFGLRWFESTPNNHLYVGLNHMSKSIIERIGSDAIKDVCATSDTFKEACERLGCGYRYLVVAATKLGCIDGLMQRSKMVAHRHKRNKVWLDRVATPQGCRFVINSNVWCRELFAGNISAPPSRIKKHLVIAGYKQNKCERCGIDVWSGEPISLQLHHIDGNPTNNSLENMMILCPNCHSQTDNFGSKNISKRDV